MFYGNKHISIFIVVIIASANYKFNYNGLALDPHSFNRVYLVTANLDYFGAGQLEMSFHVGNSELHFSSLSGCTEEFSNLRNLSDAFSSICSKLPFNADPKLLKNFVNN